MNRSEPEVPESMVPTAEVPTADEARTSDGAEIPRQLEV
jgi:hypothetical protein